jgi:uncharacterized membrane protein YccC
MSDSRLPSYDPTPSSAAPHDPHPVQSRVERGIGTIVGIAGGIAAGWILGEFVHLPWKLPVVVLAALGAWVGYRYSRDVIELAVIR